MVKITFDDTAFNRSDPTDRFDLLLGVDATITFAVNERPLFSEENFAVVELRHALGAWAASGFTDDFEFDSLDSDEHPFIWIRRQPSGQWRVGSPLLGLPDSDEITLEDASSGIADFIAAVDSWVSANLHVNVLDVLEG
jgi:hypothetical protein